MYVKFNPSKKMRSVWLAVLFAWASSLQLVFAGSLNFGGENTSTISDRINDEACRHEWRPLPADVTMALLAATREAAAAAERVIRSNIKKSEKDAKLRRISADLEKAEKTFDDAKEKQRVARLKEEKCTPADLPKSQSAS